MFLCHLNLLSNLLSSHQINFCFYNAFSTNRLDSQSEMFWEIGPPNFMINNFSKLTSRWPAFTHVKSFAGA